MASVAARRYAQAVVGLAKERSTFDPWQADLDRFREAMAEPRIARFLASPDVDEAEKARLLETALRDAQPETRNLALLLLRRHRLAIVPELVEAFTAARLAEQGIAVAEVTTAEPLSPTDEENVRSQLQSLVGKRIELRPRTDPSIIGGIVARVGDQLIDGSVVGQLSRLRARLVAGDVAVGPTR